MEKKEKAIAVLILTMLISTVVLPASGGKNLNKTEKGEQHIVDEREVALTTGDDVDWWPMFQYDPENTGYSNSTAPDTKHVLWQYRAVKSGTFQSSMIVADGRVYIGSTGWRGWRGGATIGSHGILYCLDAESGTKIWKKTYPEDEYILNTPVFYEDRIFVGIRIFNSPYGGYYHCLNADTGDVIWETPIEGKMTQASTVIDDKVYLCTRSYIPIFAKIYCLDAENGDIILNETYNFTCLGALAVADDMIYIGVLGSDTVDTICLNASNGNEIWRWSVENPKDQVYTIPTVVDGKVYVGTQGYGTVDPGGQTWHPGSVYCIDAITGEQLWKADEVEDCFFVSSAAVWNDKVYIGSGKENNEKKLYCIDANDGSLIWTCRGISYNFFFVNAGINAPAVADGKVFVGAGGLLFSKFLCLDAETGKKLWEYTKIFPFSGFCSPVIADGKVYTAWSSQFWPNGRIYCFGEAYHNLNSEDDLLESAYIR